MNDRILLIEDEAPIAESVAYSLRAEGFIVETSGDGLSGLSAFRTFSPDLVILDLMLPKLSGLDFCRIVRRESNVPILMLTAKTEEIDRIIGLEMGGDDYLPKPFSIRELIARVNAILRRMQSARDEDQKAFLEVGPIQLDLARRRVTLGGKQVHLPLKQYELLRALMSNKGRVLSREELFRRVWDADAVYDTGSLDVHIRWLREKIEQDPSTPAYIKTVRGVGYKIVCEGED
ncbi:response regulator transcription factor [bacterium]|nr:response regulator transcription factor [bacterium]